MPTLPYVLKIVNRPIYDEIHGSHVLELRIEMNVCMFLVSSSGKAGLNGDSKHDLCYAGEVLYQSSYKANFMWAKDGKPVDHGSR